MNKPTNPKASDATPLDPFADLLDGRFTRDMNIFQRLWLVMTEVDYIQKEKKEGMKYTIVSHDAVTALCRPHFVRAGVIYFPLGGSLKAKQNGNTTEAVFTVRFQSIDNADDFIDVDTMGYGVDPQDKGPGKALSYGVKYALLKALGLETGDDPDLDQGKDFNRRTSLQTKADQLATQMVKAMDASEFREIMQDPKTGEIFAALRAQDSATSFDLTNTMRAEAKRVGFDLKAFKAEASATQEKEPADAEAE